LEVVCSHYLALVIASNDEAQFEGFLKSLMFYGKLLIVLGKFNDLSRAIPVRYGDRLIIESRYLQGRRLQTGIVFA